MSRLAIWLLVILGSWGVVLAVFLLATGNVWQGLAVLIASCWCLVRGLAE